ncbi:MFS monocarboxylate transporter [Rhizodiscina lignyota]|uniref:MFS monocarboxylate transporter n=1 Tax=Rhizodiscina lignyota TaxID=1504668 RepID=A0A9P4IAK2_9PEZI|nr:MFS monocarboxylate transporter [Rhizodiscina lignyota]
MADKTVPEPLPMAKVEEKGSVDEEYQTQSTNEWNFRSCAVLIGAFLSLSCSVGFLNAFGIFQEYYQTHQLRDKSAFDITWIGSFQNFAMFFFAPIAGVLADRTGPFLPLSIGSVCTLIGVFMTSLCKEYYQFFLAQGFLQGVGVSFLTIPVVAMVSKWFVKNRGLAIGATISGSSVGGVIWPIALDQLLNEDGLSFGWTLRVVGFVILPVVIVAIILADLSIAKNVTFLLLCGGLAFMFLGLFTPLFFVTSYAAHIGMSTGLSFHLLSIANGASLFGRILPGFLADRYGPFNLLSLVAMFSGVVAFCMTAADTVGGLVVWALAYGFASGSILSLQSTCATKLATPQTAGTAVGLGMGAATITGLVGAPIAGKLVARGYLPLSMYAGATLVLGSTFLILARFRQQRKLFAIV